MNRTGRATIQATITIQGKSYGSAFLPLPDPTRSIDGYTYICHTCGESWAKITVPNRPYHLIARTCPTHHNSAHSLEVPGSILLDWMPEILLSLDASALTHEVLTHYRLNQSRHGRSC